MKQKQVELEVIIKLLEENKLELEKAENSEVKHGKSLNVYGCHIRGKVEAYSDILKQLKELYGE